jgi:hypothetical protein
MHRGRGPMLYTIASLDRDRGMPYDFARGLAGWRSAVQQGLAWALIRQERNSGGVAAHRDIFSCPVWPQGRAPGWTELS